MATKIFRVPGTGFGIPQENFGSQNRQKKTLQTWIPTNVDGIYQEKSRFSMATFVICLSNPKYVGSGPRQDAKNLVAFLVSASFGKPQTFEFFSIISGQWSLASREGCHI